MANAAEYWGPLERLLSEWWNPFGPHMFIDKLIEAGWAPAENKTEIQELLAEHGSSWSRPDDDYDSDCDCGKWLEGGYYELPDHQASVLEDSGLLTIGNS